MTRTNRLQRLAACLAAALFAAIGQAAAAPVLSLAESEVAVDSISGDGNGTLLLKADGLTGAELTQALGDVADLQSPAPPPTDIKITSNELPREASSRRWILAVNFKALPRNVSQRRYLSFDFGGQKVTLPYTLTNKSTAAFSWSVKSTAPEVNLTAGESIRLGIAVQAVPATQVRVMQVTMVEQSRKKLLDGGMLLCADTTEPCDAKGLNLKANSPNSVWLRTNAANPIVGKYVGTVTIGADQKPDGDAINLTVYGTTLCHQLLGVLCILLGVGFAWLASTYLQVKLSRAQALLPARLLTDRIGGLLQILKNAPAAIVPGTKSADALKDMQQRLSIKQLETNNYLPPAMPLPFKGMDPNVAEYKKVLADIGAKVAHLDLIINQGFASVWKRTPPAPAQPVKDALNAAIDKLDSKAVEAPVPDAAETVKFIKQVLAELDQKLAAPSAARTAAAPDNIQAGSYEALQFEISQLSGVVWLVFGGLATAVGSYILVFSNLGFGIPTDYLLCLFWGFGLPAGTQLMQSTVGSIGTALNISVPKMS